MTVPPSGLNTGGRLASEAAVVSARGCSSRANIDVALLAGDAHRERFGGEPVFGQRRGRALLAAQRERVLLLARDLVDAPPAARPSLP